MSAVTSTSCPICGHHLLKGEKVFLGARGREVCIHTTTGEAYRLR